MPRYFFDIRDNGRFARDDEGVECSGLDAAGAEASRTIGEIARDVLPRSPRRDMAVCVRDADGDLLLRAELRFSVTRFRPPPGRGTSDDSENSP